MPILVHTNEDNRECADAQTDSMADIKSYNTEKRNKSKKISTYEIEQRNMGQREEQYLAAKAEYTAAIRREKINSGKNFVI